MCLRESNVPNHTHNVTLRIAKVGNDNASGWNELQHHERLNATSGGRETKIVNVNGTSTNGVKDSLLEYQLSPLEYQNRENITYPHDNIPPYREVYIWECIATQEYDPLWQYTISYNMNGHGTVP